MKEYFSYLDPHTPAEEVYGLFITSRVLSLADQPLEFLFLVIVTILPFY